MVDPNRQFDSRQDSEFDQEMRQALRPRSAPPDFTARVMRQIPVPHTSLPLACVGEGEPPSALRPRRARIFAFPAPVRLAAVASVLIVVLAGSVVWRQHQRQVQGERARQKVFLALQITHATLQQVAQNISSSQNRKDLQP